MNTHKVLPASRVGAAHQSGSTLLEVLLAIVIFVVGMLALASLQGNLTRSSSDSNMRTVAANIAEERIENLRGEAAAGKIAYEAIAGDNFIVSRGGVDYTVDVVVEDYYFLADGESVSTTAPAGVTASSFKHADLIVTWNTGIEFQIDEDTQTGDRLGSGSIAVASIISSTPSLNNAKVAAEDDGVLGFPPVPYTPGLNPDIVSISLGADKFKESTTPEPVVRRKDELVETWFDVITFTNPGADDGNDVAGDETFLRREEFVSISCECTLRDEAEDAGRQPTLWNGAEYVEGDLADKPYGESATNQQSQYCDVCCQDHHDTEAGTESYRPHDTFSGDHPHYSRDNSGDLNLVTVGNDYVEACRLVRKDGFFRAAQDFDLQNQIAFPHDYLDEDEEVEEYSAYVTGAVEDHFSDPPPIDNYWDHTGELDFDGEDIDHPTVLDATDRQYRSRGVYTDVVNSKLQLNLDSCFNGQDGAPSLDDPDCTVTEASSPIEIFPFFDVQLTGLARWFENPQADPVDVSNEELANDNDYSRGLATLAGDESGPSTVESKIEEGNVGLTSIQPIRNVTPDDYSKANLWVQAGDDTEPPPDAITISGSLTNSAGTGSDVASVTGSGANCTRPDNTTFYCVLDNPLTVVPPTLTISNYYKKSTDLIACVSGNLLGIPTRIAGNSLSTNKTIYELPTAPQGLTGLVITIIKATSCP